MRVGVYVPDVGPESGGAHTFVHAVLCALATVPSRHEFHVLYSGLMPPEGVGELPLVRVPDPDFPLDSTVDATAARRGLDIIWFLVPPTPPVTLPFIVTVWDLEHRHQPYFPEVSVSGWTWEARELYYRSTLPQAACVVVGTEEGKRQIERFYAVPSSLIAVVPFLTPHFSPEKLPEDTQQLSDLGIQRPFLFYPAQFWPHKNHITLLYALKELKERSEFLDLVFTGSDKGNLRHVQAMTTELGLDDQVRFLGFVDRRTVATLYRKALALVFPSLFGPDNLPPLEAFGQGCPVLASAIPGSAELFGDAAIQLDPTDASAWAEAVRVLVRDPQRRTELAERGHARSRQWTPEDYVRAITARLDDFDLIRRCWSRREPYVHPDVQWTNAEAHIDPRVQLEALRHQLAASEADRAARLEVIHSLQQQLAASEADRAARLEVIHSLQQQLAVSAADRAARLEVIHTQQQQLAASEADRAARLEVIHSLQQQLAVSEADRAARLEGIQSLSIQLGEQRSALDQARIDLARTDSRLREIELSRSWRWTRLLRRGL